MNKRLKASAKEFLTGLVAAYRDCGQDLVSSSQRVQGWLDDLAAGNLSEDTFQYLLTSEKRTVDQILRTNTIQNRAAVQHVGDLLKDAIARFVQKI